MIEKTKQLWQRNYEYCDLRANETQMTEKYAAEMFKWHLLRMSKSEAIRDVNGNVAQFIVN